MRGQLARQGGGCDRTGFRMQRAYENASEVYVYDSVLVCGLRNRLLRAATSKF